MQALLQLGLSNALAAAVLAPAVAAISRIARRPPLTRALWLLVLLKLITPPLWTIHLVPRVVPSQIAIRADFIPQRADAPAVSRFPAGVSEPESVTPTEISAAPLAASVAPTAAPSHPGTWGRIAGQWPLLVSVLWIGGSAVYAIGFLIMALRLRRLLQSGERADSKLSARVAHLCCRFGCRCVPEVRLTDRPLPPMLCALGRSPRLLLPLGLWNQLSESEREVVLIHELAHLNRGDHYIRVFELIVSALYWWHPAVWWARRELREATEQCCDAWVLWAVPRCGRSYASALLQAIEFLSSARPAVPALASGMGQFHDLKRRLVMIHRGTVRRALSWPAFVMVSAGAGVLLPLSASFAAPPEAPVAVEAAPSSALPATAAPETNGGGSSVGASVAPGPEANSTASVGLAPPPAVGAAPASPAPEAATVDQARAEVAQLRAQLRNAEARLAALEHRRPGTTADPTANEVAPSAAGDELRTARARLRDFQRTFPRSGASSEQRLDALEREVQQVITELRQMRQEMQGGGHGLPGAGPARS